MLPMSRPRDTLLEIRDMRTLFPAGKTNGRRVYVRAVDGVSLDVQRGETLGVVGESGSGKSTLAFSVMGMYGRVGGEIAFDGSDINMGFRKRPLSVKRKLQIVFQDPGSSLNHRQTIRQILALPALVHRIGDKAAVNDRIMAALDMVELPASYSGKSPAAIGGGEKQMVAIARALMVQPELVILDEPTSSLDVSIQAKIINMLLRLQIDQGLTYIFISHDLSLMRNMASRVAIMYLGKVCELASTEMFFENPLHPYTKMLLSSVPVVSEDEVKLKPERVVSSGEIPSPVNIPTGCSFHSRCPHVDELCTEEDPEMVEYESGHFVRCHACVHV